MVLLGSRVGAARPVFAGGGGDGKGGCALRWLAICEAGTARSMLAAEPGFVDGEGTGVGTGLVGARRVGTGSRAVFWSGEGRAAFTGAARTGRRSAAACERPPLEPTKKNAPIPKITTPMAAPQRSGAKLASATRSGSNSSSGKASSPASDAGSSPSDASDCWCAVAAAVGGRFG